VKEYNKLMHEEITSPSFDDFIDLVFPSEKVTPAKAGVQ